MSYTSVKEQKKTILQKLETGLFKDAKRIAAAGAKKFSEDADFWTLLGLTHFKQHHYRASIPSFENAYKLMPAEEIVQENLAAAYEAAHQPEKAVAFLTAMSKKNAGSHAHLLLVRLLLRIGRWEAAVDAADGFLAASPNNAEAYFLRAQANVKRGQNETADADFFSAHQLAPDTSAYAEHYANSLNENGKAAEAEAVYWKSLEGSAASPVALLELSGLASEERRKELKHRIQDAVEANAQPRHMLDFALARVEERDKGLDAALPVYAQANASQRLAQPFDATLEEQQFRQAETHVQRGFPQMPAETDLGPRPVFIVGQPRSGTTLLEAMLTAGGRVSGLGELNLGPELTADYMLHGKRFGQKQAQQLAADFRTRLPDLQSGISHFIDKLPHNYRFLGFLAAAMPNARFLCLLRDPKDVALSSWAQHFQAAGMSYTNGLDTLATNANYFRRYMNLWCTVFPTQIVTVRYEDLVRDARTTGKAITSFLGLPWDEAILRHETQVSDVRTASVQQVRKGLTSTSIGRWQPHADHLRPFTDSLDDVLWPEYG